MIVVNLTSGLGNQLFQYSFYRALSILYPKYTILLDITHYDNSSFRNFGLNSFNTRYNTASTDEIKQLKHKAFNPRFLLGNILFNRRRGYIQHSKSFWEVLPRKDFSILPVLSYDNIYYKGYFLNERYFKTIRETLLKELTLKKEMESDRYVKYKEIIKNSDSISIHFRRGDYVNNKHLNLLEVPYYNRALSYVCKLVKNPRIFIFSDDIDWVTKNFKTDMQYTIVHLEDYLELSLMSFCKHNIIANSTFSWWGAWLNKNTNPVIVAPEIWYKDAIAQKWYQKSDYVPNNWIRL